MSLPITIENIHFGERDALHEFMKQDRQDLTILENSFVTPPRVKLSELQSGARYYIVGPKGSGKTTLLWHLKRSVSSNTSKVILFKSHLRKEDRDQLDNMTDMIVVEDQKKFRVEYDYKTIFEWYILKNIVRLIDIHDIFMGKDVFSDIVLLLEANKKRFNTLYDKFHIDSVKGAVKLNIDVGMLKSELRAEVVARRNADGMIQLLDLVRLVQASLSSLRLKEGKAFRLYFDELEFFMEEHGEGERDRRMVRDLLFSVYSVNELCANSKLNIVVYSSVRSEILQSISATTQELSKLISAFGVSLDWYNESIEDHPVLEIFKNKIINSEIALEGAYSINVWSVYFPKLVHGKEFRRYLLDSGLHRPRGVLMRLVAAAEFAYGQTSFREDDFVNSDGKFGDYMLEEFLDEISASFDEKMRNVIVSVFKGNRWSFTKEEFEQRVRSLAVSHKDAKTLLANYSIEGILRLLFRIGMIGNQFKIENTDKTRQVWAFRKETDPLFEKRFVLHSSVRKALETV